MFVKFVILLLCPYPPWSSDTLGIENHLLHMSGILSLMKHGKLSQCHRVFFLICPILKQMFDPPQSFNFLPTLNFNLPCTILFHLTFITMLRRELSLCYTCNYCRSEVDYLGQLYTRKHMDRCSGESTAIFWLW